MQRKKTAIERFLSFNQHRKRWGAGKHSTTGVDFAAMKVQIVGGNDDFQTRGSEKSLDAHLANLRREFSRQPELLFHHAKLIVLMRREHQVDATYAHFKELWEREAEFLCENLNIRWLISACDTFADLDGNEAIRNAALTASVLVNTVKIYESERFVTDVRNVSPNAAKVDRLQTELVPLFEGMSCFTVGTDDTLRNMRWRLENLFKARPVGLILKTIYDRLQVNDTAFGRLRSLHQRPRTSWW